MKIKARHLIPGWPRPHSTTKADYYRPASIWEAVMNVHRQEIKRQYILAAETESRLCFLASRQGLQLTGARWNHEFCLTLDILGRNGWLGWYSDGHEEFQVRKAKRSTATEIVTCLPSGDLLSGWPGSLFADESGPRSVPGENSGDGTAAAVDLSTLQPAHG